MACERFKLPQEQTLEERRYVLKNEIIGYKTNMNEKKKK